MDFHGIPWNSMEVFHTGSEAKADLRLWLSFPSKFDGKSFFLDDEWFNSHKLNLFTDCTIFGTHWCYGRWPNEWAYTNIVNLEFFSHRFESVPVGS